MKSTVVSATVTQKEPLVFEEYFEMGQQEAFSPFITPASRGWGENLSLKSAIAAAVLLLLSFILSFNPQALPFSYLALAAVYFLAGIPSLIESLEDLVNFDVNIDVLMTLAAFSSVFIGSGTEGGLLLVLFALSGSMEDAVSSKAKSAISSLHKLSPTTAFVLEADGTLVERSVKEVSAHTAILVKAGQVVPLDGKVIAGTSSVNLVHLTGENFPVTKQVGDEVPAGARNLDGALTLDVLRVSGESTLARIIQLVTQAQEARPVLQRWFDSVSRKYAISIILLTFTFAAAFPFLLGIPFLGMEGSLYRSLAFLIAASPCALIIALPIAYLSAVSVCAKNGILLKGGIVLDALAGCRAIAFDKTGTLTEGNLSCVLIEPLYASAKFNEEELLSAAFGLEKNAIHPIAKAIVNFAESKQLKPLPVKEFKSIPGFGLEGVLASAASERSVYIGKPDFIYGKLSPKDAKALEMKIAAVQKKGEMVSVMLVDKEVFIFHFVDQIRPKIKRTIQALQKHWGLDTVMLTGDHESSAARVAHELGINAYHADLKPEDKLSLVAALAQKQGLAMVGDGINDAPALARATVGICMGKVGTTSAMEASDIVLLHDNIETLDWLYGIAKKTQKIVRQNLVVATAAIIGASLPALAGVVPLWLAVILHEGGTVLVGLNALRLLRR